MHNSYVTGVCSLSSLCLVSSIFGAMLPNCDRRSSNDFESLHALSSVVREYSAVEPDSDYLSEASQTHPVTRKADINIQHF